jgi:hypothetical protein
MARSEPNRRRHRPRRQTRRHPPARGFTGPGGRQLFDAILSMQGQERKRYFNQVSAWLVLGLSIGGAMVGYAWAGIVGAVLGFGAGVTAGGTFVERQRFYRR